MQKILAITRRELYSTFTDRSLLLIMIVAPLAISVIVGLVFGGLNTGGGISNIPVIIVNQDEGADSGGGEPVNYGDIFVSVISPAADAGDAPADFGGDCPIVDAPANGEGADDQPFNIALSDLFDAQQMDDPAAARAAVDSGEATAAIVIPADFSARLAPDVNPFGNGGAAADPLALEIYATSASPITASIVRGVVEGFVNQWMSGNIGIEATLNTLIAANPMGSTALANNETVNDLFGCAFTDALYSVSLSPQSIRDADEEQLDAFGFSITSAILVQTGSAQAVLFALFAGQFGIISIVNERRTGTLQRMIVSPTSRGVILAGKLFGTFVTIVFQIIILLVALILVASVVEGHFAPIFGTNLVLIALLVLALALAVSGLSVFLSGIARTPEQVGTFGSLVNLGLGLLGGAFGFAVPEPFSYLSLIYWGRVGFQDISAGDLGDIPLILTVLVVQGAILFGIGVAMFRSQIEE
jgi:ABC-type Na+ efflux pump permease subunit